MLQKRTFHTEGITRRGFLKKAGKAALCVCLPPLLGACKGGEQGLSVSRGHENLVVISRFRDYDPAGYQALKRTVGEMVEATYERRPFFSRGDRIAMKVNLVSSLDALQRPATETYTTHPLVVMALVEVFGDLGAGAVDIVEGATFPSNTKAVFAFLGYGDLFPLLGGGTLIDLNSPDPYKDFGEIQVQGGLVYRSIKVNRRLLETDCLVSVSKLKCHSTAGVTLSMKNLIGLLPVQVYGAKGTGARIEFVHGSDPSVKVPHNIIDVASIFPSDFSMIDGITAMDRGEGPWVEGPSFTTPGVLIAGLNPVAVDSVGASVMGFDPGATYPNSPFVNALNHLRLASEYGLGSHILEDMEILGETIQDVLYPYAPPL